ncbi:PREDICTED: uncharacterized protein LOC109379710 [Hipposideros armiger]|uniref:Uncharacterized protein LOC109379710 n=1 Tax=Hipposideros armiger TaxID=186990 RepID=A0A8B7QWD8_HIPAR|nr:PREDICTED: uncharacterized protein LOC109379710 [Hipposideros armiger]
MINPLRSQALSQQPDLASVEGDSAGGPWMSPALPATATATKGAAEEGGRRSQVAAKREQSARRGGEQLQIWFARQTRGSEITAASVQRKEGAKSGRGSSAPQHEGTVGEGREKPGGLSCPGVASKHQIYFSDPSAQPALPSSSSSSCAVVRRRWRTRQSRERGLGQLPPPAASPQRPGRGAQQKLREKSNAARTATGCQRRAHFLNLLPAATERRNTDSASSRGQAPRTGLPRPATGETKRKEKEKAGRGRGWCRREAERNAEWKCGLEEREGVRVNGSVSPLVRRGPCEDKGRERPSPGLTHFEPLCSGSPRMPGWRVRSSRADGGLCACGTHGEEMKASLPVREPLG